MTKNQLAYESSPYLLQHKDNPVHWMGWGEDALNLATSENKPILLSVGYAACHWCHVMAHETFENTDIADIMNELFINIKVDREERPDLDSIYQNAIAMLGQQGGWPLTVFLTPDGTPFWGGTYFPPKAKWGRPGFSDILYGVSNAFHERPEDIEKNAGPLMDGIKQLSKPEKGDIASVNQIDKISSCLVSQVDFINGGVGQAPKFPQPMILKQLWNAKLRNKDKTNDSYERAINATLNGLCQGGIYDHLGGGFSRYSVDDRWLAPHFEKMLYDNAQLISLLTNIWQDTKNPLYRTRIFETIDWVIRDLSISEGAYASSLDADSEGVEGKFYVWNAIKIDEILKKDAAFFKNIYDVSAAGNWEGCNILNLLNLNQDLSTAEIAQLEQNKKTLLAVRNKRVPPSRDDKILADWNGLMIKALIKAGDVFNQAQWIEAGKKCFKFITTHMTDGAHLYHSWCNGKTGAKGLLEDYANMMDAAISLYEISAEPLYLDHAKIWAKCLDETFRDDIDGAFFTSAKDNLDLIANQKSASDNAVPSGNGLLLGAFTKLYLIDGNEIYQARAEEIIHNFSGELDRNFYPLSSFINNTEFFLKPLQIIIIGKGIEAQNLRDKLNNIAIAECLYLTISDPSCLPPNHPARLKTTVNGKAAAYICEGEVCSLPIIDPDELFQRLQQ